jgi:hypothetical protein
MTINVCIVIMQQQHQHISIDMLLYNLDLQGAQEVLERFCQAISQEPLVLWKRHRCQKMRLILKGPFTPASKIVRRATFAATD